MTDPKRALVVLLTAGLAVIVGCQPADATDEPKTTSSEVPGQAAPPAVDHAALDAVLRAQWLRRVETRPADYLRLKFLYQHKIAELNQQKEDTP